MRGTTTLASAPVSGNSQIGALSIYVFRHKMLVLVVAICGAAAAYGSSYLFAPQYKANATLIPSDEILGLNTNNLLGNLGGLSSLVGAGAASSKQSEAVETLKSRALALQFIDANKLLPVLFPKKWDAVAGHWKVEGKSRVPTMEDAYRVFDKQIRSVIENRKSGLIEISVTWTDPAMAKEWVMGLVNAGNDLLRTQALERSDKNLEYLKKASETTTVMEVRTAIYKLMETEIKKQMVAFGGRDYAFRFVDPPVVPERKVFPNRILFLIVGAVLSTLALLAVASLNRFKALATT